MFSVDYEKICGKQMVLSLDIFVAGIPLDIKDSEFKALFQSYGSVTFSTIVKDKKTNSTKK